jgi:hypothetical protein
VTHLSKDKILKIFHCITEIHDIVNSGMAPGIRLPVIAPAAKHMNRMHAINGLLFISNKEHGSQLAFPYPATKQHSRPEVSTSGLDYTREAVLN